MINLSTQELYEGARVLFTSMLIGQSIGTTLRAELNRKNMAKYSEGFIADRDTVLRNWAKVPLENTNVESLGALEEYYQKLKIHLTSKEIKLLNYNIKNLNLTFNLFQLLTFKGGTYKVESNEMKYTYAELVGHELEHVSSSTILKDGNENDEKKRIILSGFHQQQNNTHIGIGINDGFTELENSRVFNKGKVHTHKTLTRLASLTELFFDEEEQMRGLYHRTNLPDLIKQVGKHSSQEEAMNVIKDMDYIWFCSESLNPMTIIKGNQVQKDLHQMYVYSETDGKKIKRFENRMSVEPEKPKKMVLVNKKVC